MQSTLIYYTETKSSNDSCVKLECDNGTTKLWSVECQENADLFCNNTCKLVIV